MSNAQTFFALNLKTTPAGKPKGVIIAISHNQTFKFVRCLNIGINFMFSYSHSSACCAGFYYHQSNLWLMCQNMCSHYAIIIYLVESNALILEAIIFCLFMLYNISALVFIHILLKLVSLSLFISLPSALPSLCLSALFSLCSFSLSFSFSLFLSHSVSFAIHNMETQIQQKISPIPSSTKFSTMIEM